MESSKCGQRLTLFLSQGPHSQIFMTGGGSDRGSYFIPKKITTSEFVYPKYHYFFNRPKKIPWFFFSNPKNPSVFFFATHKNPGVFHRPQKITFGQNFRPKKSLGPPPIIKICKWGPWGSYCDRVILQSYTEFYHKTSILGQWKLIIWLASPPPPPRMDSVFCFIVHRRLFLTTTNNEAPKSDKIGI